MRHVLLFFCHAFWSAGFLFAQSSPTPLDRVLTQTGYQYGARDLPQDHGANGLWQKLLKLQTTGSVMHTTAHPDDEHADLLTYMSRGLGARTALFSLNRGEGGANVLGPELFEELGLLRTEELLLAGSYYGLDDLYFTDAVDYGFSKRVAEAYQKWDRQHVLGEMVRVIRLNRPLVIVSRFHGSERDGHGNHQAAGELTQEAFKLAGDPKAFPEQLTKEGLRAWKPLKLYRGGIRSAEPYQWVLESGEYCPWLGSSYKNFSLLGYSFHRSQFSGIRWEANGPFRQLYERLIPVPAGNRVEQSIFEGIDTAITGIPKLTGEAMPKEVPSQLAEAQKAIAQAISNFQWQNPSVVVQPLVTALSQIRAALSLTARQPETQFLLRIKEKQLMETIHTALGASLQATAVSAKREQKKNLFQTLPSVMAAVPGQPFGVEVNFLNPSAVPVEVKSVSLLTPPHTKVAPNPWEAQTLYNNQQAETFFTVALPENADLSEPYFSRASIHESRYAVSQEAFKHLPYGFPAFRTVVTYQVYNQPVTISQTVLTRTANLPYGYDWRSLKILPAIAVNINPTLGVIPLQGQQKPITVQVDVLNQSEGPITGSVRLALPEGWQAQPASFPFTFSKAGEKSTVPIKVLPAQLSGRTYSIQAIAQANGKEYKTGYQLISYRDQDPNYIFKPATIQLKGIDVKIIPNAKVGYVMGAGDDIPAALQQVGAQVQLLTAAELANADLQGFRAIMVGSRAYAVRQDLLTYNQRLLAYAKAGGHLIVLYQTPEFVPERMAAFPAQLPPNAEEVSEEDAPVQILASGHPFLNEPNKITTTDFNGWVEQRGSKFFSQWDPAYEPIIATQDQGQEPQKGGWLTAPYGKGHYTYFAYALHRQLPYGVPGAYRILANLISYGQPKKK